MLVKIATIAALYVTGTNGERSRIYRECLTPGGLRPYDFCFDTEVGATVFWNFSFNNTIDFAFTGEGAFNDWLAVGFSDDGAMVPSNVVFGCIWSEVTDGPIRFRPDAQGADFALTNRSEDGVMQAGNQMLQDYTQTFDNGDCTVTFRRPIDIGEPNQRIGNRRQDVIVATGQFDTIPRTTTASAINRHRRDRKFFRDSFKVNFLIPVGVCSRYGGILGSFNGTDVCCDGLNCDDVCIEDGCETLFRRNSCCPSRIAQSEAICSRSRDAPCKLNVCIGYNNAITGYSNGTEVCCDRDCGLCAEDNCDDGRGLGEHECCPSKIIESGRYCPDGNRAPCMPSGTSANGAPDDRNNGNNPASALSVPTLALSVATVLAVLSSNEL